MMPKRSKNDAKIDIKSVFFQCDVLKAVFMEIRVFLQENRGFLGCGVSKKVAKTHENDVRNGCLRNVLKIDGFLIKTELQNVAKTTQKNNIFGMDFA